VDFHAPRLVAVGEVRYSPSKECNCWAQVTKEVANLTILQAAIHLNSSRSKLQKTQKKIKVLGGRLPARYEASGGREQSWNLAPKNIKNHN
jgi:hypothetical protein